MSQWDSVQAYRPGGDGGIGETMTGVGMGRSGRGKGGGDSNN